MGCKQLSTLLISEPKQLLLLKPVINLEVSNSFGKNKNSKIRYLKWGMARDILVVYGDLRDKSLNRSSQTWDFTCKKSVGALMQLATNSETVSLVEISQVIYTLIITLIQHLITKITHHIIYYRGCNYQSVQIVRSTLDHHTHKRRVPFDDLNCSTLSAMGSTEQACTAVLQTC